VIFSLGHFVQAFTHTIGFPPHRYLISLGLTAAEQLLTDSVLTICEIAYASGFSRQSHLITVMRKYKSLMPAQLRGAT
jgi:AraC family transcriptional regulator